MSVATVIDSGRIVRNQFTEGWWAEFTEPPLKVKEPGYKGGKNKAWMTSKNHRMFPMSQLAKSSPSIFSTSGRCPSAPKEDTTAVTTTTCRQNGLSTIPDPLEKYFF